MFGGLFVSLIPQELLAVLACPKCKGDLTVDESRQGLVCYKCSLLYEVRDGIPIMLEEEAQKIDLKNENKKDE
ncbi:protein of unknown function DUF343 [Thermodesulfatator indicus DSM 15286]|uniref:UPF0434 protein Thein_0133 n=1 Tax=Thermodesulfatator indicus (strain DSM 15286 / JCM 11887 / CIR29812) TaxID=667014 RepID=F8A8X1_THEID|nr:Trm112 family protein [Thermodesulfatator indicus]AEH44018.1 protein of unknown function DUF343 [Thermodesulfatator indicus DSM 15286]